MALIQGCPHAHRLGRVSYVVQDSKKEELLDAMLAGEMGYVEAERESAEVKAITRLKEAMCSEVELDTWEEVEATIPEFAKVDVLKTFQVQKGKKPPEDFLVRTDQVFCQTLFMF